MATSDVTSTPIIRTAKTQRWSGSFLGYSEKSKVQQMLEAKTAEKAKAVSYQDRPEYMQMKAMQLKAMMTTYKNLGMTEAYNATEIEAQALVVKYLKMQNAGKGTAVDTEA